MRALRGEEKTAILSSEDWPAFADGLPNKDAKRPEAFALDLANELYHADVAHLCEKCGYWHLSRFERLYGRLPETPD